MHASEVEEVPLLEVIYNLLEAHTHLEKALLHEKEMLTNLNAETMLLNLSHEKQKILEKISQLEQALMACLSFSSSQTLRQQIEQAINQVPSSSQAAAQNSWVELIGVVKRCKDLNQVNASIVQASLSHNRKQLNILNSIVSTGIYDEKGSIL